MLFWLLMVFLLMITDIHSKKFYILSLGGWQQQTLSKFGSKMLFNYIVLTVLIAHQLKDAAAIQKSEICIQWARDECYPNEMKYVCVKDYDGNIRKPNSCSSHKETQHVHSSSGEDRHHHGKFYFENTF